MQSLIGRFWIMKNGKNFLGEGRIMLLKNIADTGSISQAAKIMKMSYKAAWDDVDMMNNLSDTPLVIKNTGGKQGGGTELTDRGKQLVHEYGKLSQIFDQHISVTQLLLEYYETGTSLGNSFSAKIVNAEKTSTSHTRLVLRTAKGMTFYATVLTAYYKKYLNTKECWMFIAPTKLSAARSDEAVLKEYSIESVIVDIKNEDIYVFIETELETGERLTLRVMENSFKKSGLKKNAQLVLMYDSDDINVTNGE